MSRATRSGWVRQSGSLAETVMGAWLYRKEAEDGVLTVLTNVEDGLFHLSISHRVTDEDGFVRPGRYPTWDEIREAREEFCPANAVFVMYLPPKEEYVNLHPTTFHLWELPEEKDPRPTHQKEQS